MLAVVNDGHDIGGNDTDAEGGNSDAETVPGSRVTMPESLQTPLPRHVTADSCTAAKSGKVLTPIPSNYCEVEDFAETLLLRGGEGIGYNL